MSRTHRREIPGRSRDPDGGAPGLHAAIAGGRGSPPALADQIAERRLLARPARKAERQAEQRLTRMTRVAILVPGIMGSVLKLKNEVIWPGALDELLLPYRKMKQLMLTDLDATDVIRSFSFSQQYADLIGDL